MEALQKKLDTASQRTLNESVLEPCWRCNSEPKIMECYDSFFGARKMYVCSKCGKTKYAHSWRNTRGEAAKIWNKTMRTIKTKRKKRHDKTISI